MLEASTSALTPIQTTEYYPFGLAFTYNNLDKNKQLFSGKELQDAELAKEIVGWYDFGSRFYDPVVARWFCQDPASQLASPYVYCGNNPVAFVDPGESFLAAFYWSYD
ncbi:MAG: RHS repeat-associated core domain-containing protein [Butyricimonas paravirosa]